MKELVTCGWWLVSGGGAGDEGLSCWQGSRRIGERRGYEDPPPQKLEKELKAESLRPTEGEKPGEEEGDWLDCEESMA